VKQRDGEGEKKRVRKTWMRWGRREKEGRKGWKMEGYEGWKEMERERERKRVH
jgi:hypothetical protein